MKKKLSLCFIALICLVGGSVFILQYSNVNKVKAQDTQTSVVNQTKTEESSKDETQETQKNTESSKEEDSTPSRKVMLERQAFTKKVVDSGFYLENVDAQGRLTYVKATPEAIQALQEEAKDNQLSTYQVFYQGQMISVLSK